MTENNFLTGTNSMGELFPHLANPDGKYKDRLFRMIFREKKDLLNLYNAVNGTDYTNSDELEVTTLENAIYMNMKNDTSFVFDMCLNLYEHQSTYNPNMPLRNLFYIARILERMTVRKTLYGTSFVQIPTPKFVVFYNGTSDQPERQTLKLSDAFQKETAEPELELKVLMLNINLGMNRQIVEKCRTLQEYVLYVTKIREYARVMDIVSAVERAVHECISEGILADFLLNYRAEAIQMSIFEYDAEKELRLMQEAAIEDGLEQGIEQGIEAFILDNIEEGTPQERILAKLQRRFPLHKEQAEKYYLKYAGNK